MTLSKISEHHPEKSRRTRLPPLRIDCKQRRLAWHTKAKRLTAPPTSYSSQLTCVPLRLMSNECSLTPSVCSRTFRISPKSRLHISPVLSRRGAYLLMADSRLRQYDACCPKSCSQFSRRPPKEFMNKRTMLRSPQAVACGILKGSAHWHDSTTRILLPLLPRAYERLGH